MPDQQQGSCGIRLTLPCRVLIASIMEEYDRDAWETLIERCEEAGVDAFEVNFSCPHGMPERKMGMAMGQDTQVLRVRRSSQPSIVWQPLGTGSLYAACSGQGPWSWQEVSGWINRKARVPVWAKMTPNVTDITLPARAALESGSAGVAAINTIQSVMGINLKTLRPEPSVEGHSTPGGYSSKAVKPIALAKVRSFLGCLGQSEVQGCRLHCLVSEAIERPCCIPQKHI